MTPTYRLLILLAWLTQLLTCAGDARAEHEPTSGLYETLTGGSLARLPGLKNLDINAGGWLSVGVTYNAHNPSDHGNGTVTFNDRASEFQLNQLNLFLERSVDKGAKRWDLGGRLDFMWGTDSRFTQASGNWDDDLIDSNTLRFYDIALPQAYVELTTPLVRGATLKLGHFYTLLGQEVVQSPNNFFYSHSYAMQYGEPFTHTGVLLSYPVNDNFSANLGAVTGPYKKADNFDQNLQNWNFLGAANWLSSDGATAVALALTSGPADSNGRDNRTIASLVINHDLSEKLHYIFQYDHGFEERAVAEQQAQWYGINQYLIYALTDSISAGLRYEWFRDDDGFRVSDAAASYYEVSGGLNWKPKQWLLLRAEARGDWLDGPQRLFDVKTRKSQFTLGANAVVTF